MNFKIILFFIVAIVLAMADARLRLRKGGYGGIHNGRIYGGGFGRRDGGYGSIGPGGIYGGGFGRR
ncbi:hypothetical protein DERP_005717 [Dermatophagoides pteronyssinus]|uniref:Uncharacterized protein n=1 Tax=Dermatophagoides pteronyssinus TaxID=6956 RepID=A0ABQ8J9C7_DERPT|nr:hypothetical protein DERP_005717 [Dermatophagoides pteronyssinus]